MYISMYLSTRVEDKGIPRVEAVPISPVGDIAITATWRLVGYLVGWLVGLVVWLLVEVNVCDIWIDEVGGHYR